MASYVAPYSSGYVVLVNDRWYGPGCTQVISAWPPSQACVWSDLVAAQNCYNAKISSSDGSSDGSTKTCPTGSHWDSNWKACIKDGDIGKAIEGFYRAHTTTALIVGFGGVLLFMNLGKRR
ncbi:MAG: hypothetical protein ACYC4L_11415 [Chloroflexota bacterium]